MNKRGFLLGEETLKIIIALICIVFLIYLLSALYFNYRDNKDLEMAKASLEHLIKEINAGSTEVEIYNPDGWYVSSWAGDDKPDSCSTLGWDNCICICEDLVRYKVNIDIATECDKKGTCLESDFSIEDGTIKIEKPPLLLLINHEEKIVTRK